MQIAFRVSAAWAAFAEPRLVGEALGMRKTVAELTRTVGKIAVLSPMVMGADILPRVDFLPPIEAAKVRNILGLQG